ncbi:MAG: hypothetical protein Q9167_004291 [Letrouitia subvulpina]
MNEESFRFQEKTDNDTLQFQKDSIAIKNDVTDAAAFQDAREMIAEEMQRELEDTMAKLQNALKALDDAIATQLHDKRVKTSERILKPEQRYETVPRKIEEQQGSNLSLENSSLETARISGEEQSAKPASPFKLTMQSIGSLPYTFHMPRQPGLPVEGIGATAGQNNISSASSSLPKPLVPDHLPTQQVLETPLTLEVEKAFVPLDDNSLDLDTIINGANDKIFCVLDYGLAYDLLTSVPAKDLGWVEDAQGGSFGCDVSWKFCEEHYFNQIVRAGECLKTDYKNIRKAKLISLWSAPGYRSNHNLGAILIVNEKLELCSKKLSKNMCARTVCVLKEITKVTRKIRTVDELDDDELENDA